MNYKFSSKLNTVASNRRLQIKVVALVALCALLVTSLTGGGVGGMEDPLAPMACTLGAVPFLQMRTPLRDKATEGSEGGSGNSASKETEEVAETETPEQTEPSVFDRAKSLMKSKGGLQSSLTTALASVKSLTADNATLTEKVSTLTTELAGYKQSEKDLEAHITKLEGEATTTQEAVVDKITQLGVTEEEIPKQDSGQVESFEEKYLAAKKKGGAEFSAFLTANRQEISKLIA